MNESLVPLVADLAGLVLYFYGLPILVNCFEHKSVSNAFLVLAVYILFSFSAFLIRKTDTTQIGEDYRYLLGFLGVFLGFLVIFMMEDLSGLLRDPDRLSEWGEVGGGVPVLLVGACGLGLVFLYPGALWLNVQPSQETSHYLTGSLRLMGTLGVNLMILVTIAHWQVYFAGAEPYEDLTFRGRIVVFVAVYAFFLLFYAPPRLFLVFRGVSGLSFFTFFLTSTLYVWRCLYPVKNV